MPEQGREPPVLQPQQLDAAVPPPPRPPRPPAGSKARPVRAPGKHRLGAVALVFTTLLVGACSSSSPQSGSGSNPSDATTASALNSAYTDVVDEVSPSVVLIQTSSGLGSGEVYATKGDVITNAHLVRH